MDATPSGASRGSVLALRGLSASEGFAMPNQHTKNPLTVEERFWAKIDKDGPSGCWLWTGARIPDGYGTFKIRQVTTLVHRYAYEQMVGLISAELEIDHICRTTNCVNPNHLEAVPHIENVRRGLAGKVNNHESRKTHCSGGHPYDLLNTYITPKGERECRLCRRIRKRLRRIH